MRFLEYYGGTWRDKIVLHRTPTGRLSRAKVGSLPAEEQWKYNPDRYKRTGADKKVTKKDYEKIVPIEDIQYLLEFWMAIKDRDELGQFEEDKLVLATDDSTIVNEVFDEDYLPVRLKSVPLDAVVKYGVIDEDGNIEWKEFDEELTSRQKYDFVKFEDNNIFLLDLFPYVERIDVKLDVEDD
ncbi:MAG: hypothetical protein ACOC33_02160 [bacterium]